MPVQQSDPNDLIEALTLSERRLVAIEAAGDGIGMVDSNGNLTYINKAMMALHGIRKDQLGEYIGHPWEKLYNEKGQKEIHEKVLPVLKSMGAWIGESPVERRDGKVIIAEMSLTLLPDGGFIGTARDVTESRKEQKEKEDLQKQFFQAQKMEAIGRLAGGIAHDFNNILASIMGYAEFLLEDLDEQSKQHHFSRQIMQGAVQARQLIEQILTFSRRKESARETLDASAIVNEAMTMLQATMPATIALDTKIDTENSLISGNKTQITQILMNLCVNARDAMEDGHGVLRIGVYRTTGAEENMPMAKGAGIPEQDYALGVRISTEGKYTSLLLGIMRPEISYIAISVEDTGCGIAREVMEHMFEPFFTTKEVDKGTGLGLSTVMGMVAGHQGTLAVRSSVGRGTVFTVYFPAVSGEAAVAETNGMDEIEIMGSGRILLVEDQGHVQKMMSIMLERLGYKSDFCTTAAEAIDNLRENPGYYDLVLSDYMMPEITGVEMAKVLLEDFPDLPIVMISGHDVRMLKTMAANLPNIRTILKKPVSKQTLARALGQILGSGAAKEKKSSAG